MKVFVMVVLFTLTGCGVFGTKKIETVSKPVEKTPLDLPDPRPLDLDPYLLDWKVILDGEDVYYGLTPQGYKNLSIMFLEIRNHLEQQKNVTNQYRKYYEKPVTNN
jgi:hypothetical protein